MPKVPRDINARELIQYLKIFEYSVIRQTGCHIRLASNYMGINHQITIPNHSPIKIGTMNSILNDIADYLKIDKSALIEILF